MGAVNKRALDISKRISLRCQQPHRGRQQNEDSTIKPSKSQIKSQSSNSRSHRYVTKLHNSSPNKISKIKHSKRHSTIKLRQNSDGDKEDEQERSRFIEQNSKTENSKIAVSKTPNSVESADYGEILNGDTNNSGIDRNTKIAKIKIRNFRIENSMISDSKIKNIQSEITNPETVDCKVEDFGLNAKLIIDNVKLGDSHDRNCKFSNSKTSNSRGTPCRSTTDNIKLEANEVPQNSSGITSNNSGPSSKSSVETRNLERNHIVNSNTDNNNSNNHDRNEWREFGTNFDCYNSTLAREFAQNQHLQQQRSRFYNFSSRKKPAELFRKDLISAMKLPDSEQLNHSDYLLIVDTWKEEWEKGVQVPVNSLDSLPEPKYRLASSDEDKNHDNAQSIQNFINGDAKFNNDDFNKSGNLQKMPREWIRYDSKHHCLSSSCCNNNDESSDQIEYELDTIDLCWRDLVSQTCISPIPESLIELTITELERQCDDNMRNGNISLEYSETVVCNVCRSPHGEHKNEMIFCDNCNVCVHQACYDVHEIPHGPWFCQPCRELGPRARDLVSCILCPNKGGAMRRCTTNIDTDTGSSTNQNTNHWAHVSCALWVVSQQLDHEQEQLEQMRKSASYSRTAGHKVNQKISSNRETGAQTRSREDANQAGIVVQIKRKDDAKAIENKKIAINKNNKRLKVNNSYGTTTKVRMQNEVDSRNEIGVRLRSNIEKMKNSSHYSPYPRESEHLNLNQSQQLSTNRRERPKNPNITARVDLKKRKNVEFSNRSSNKNKKETILIENKPNQEMKESNQTEPKSTLSTNNKNKEKEVSFRTRHLRSSIINLSKHQNDLRSSGGSVDH